jgi:valyl-tRNA synthetase
VVAAHRVNPTRQARYRCVGQRICGVAWVDRQTRQPRALPARYPANATLARRRFDPRHGYRGPATMPRRRRLDRYIDHAACGRTVHSCTGRTCAIRYNRSFTVRSSATEFVDLAKSFEPRSIEQRWYAFWESQGLFRPSMRDDAPAFCIQLPPPNVTGTLHMGHAFQHTLMDVLIRYHRMRGDNTLWQVGTDHAGIATQIVVENQLRAEGTTRHALGREKFVERVWAWKEESGSTITRQMRRLGTSGDWSRERFTMDPRLSAAVLETFVRLHDDGLIYRGKRLVNWDPKLGTAVSELEVESEEETGKLWEIRYPLVDGSGSLIVATTRPETMLGDVAVAVNPDDERYTQFVGKDVELPLTGRRIPVIADAYVDKNFGTGCVKITPAHDFNDWEVAQRHGLAPITIFTLSAVINDNAPAKYRGLDRYVARKAVLADLAAEGLLVSEKPHKMVVPRCGRSGEVIEPMLTDQWFVAMTKPAPDTHPFFPGKSFQDICLEAVNASIVVAGSQPEQIRFVPEHWTSTYNHWLENVHDWCISRQLWWGHRIPAWYDDDGNYVVARNLAEAAAKSGKPPSALRQDEDVLDTWFSSALWCHSTLGWPEQTKELATFLPSSVLVTGFDIIFFWVVRMVMTTTYFTGKVPFRDVYINSIVRDDEGQKMSKSKGNILDPLDLIDGTDLESLVQKRTAGLLLEKQRDSIEKRTRKQFPNGIPGFGADAVRFTFASLATFGRTLNFDLSRCEGYRNFCNKLWNATRFVLMNVEGKDVGLDDALPKVLTFADRWLVGRLQQAEHDIADNIASYRFDLAAKALYEFAWEEYCDWYVELAKVQLQRADASGDEASARGTRSVLIRVLEALLRLAHPFIPFITEELWQSIASLAGKRGTSISIQPFPKADFSRVDAFANADVALLKQIVDACRAARGEMNLSPGLQVPLIATGDAARLSTFTPYMQALARLSGVNRVDELPRTDAPVHIVGEFKLMLHIEVDPARERERIGKEIAQVEGEMGGIAAKLANDAFVNRAPQDVVAKAREQLALRQSTLQKLRAQLDRLSDAA